MSASKSSSVNRDFVLYVGGHVLAMQLAGMRDPSARDDAHLDRLADLSVRAALALEAAIPRAEERLAAEAKAAEEAKIAAEEAEKAALVAQKAAEKKAADDAAAAHKAAEKAAADHVSAEKAAAKELEKADSKK